MRIFRKNRNPVFPGNVLKRVTVIWLLCLWACLPSVAQVFKYYGVTDGLSDRRVLSLQKDSIGYMWLLTYSGIDRFDGKDVKHYRIVCDDGYVAFYSEKNILKTDSHGRVWTVSPDGLIFCYNPLSDEFEEIPTPEEWRQHSPEMIEITQMDEVWLCYHGYAFVYDINRREMRKVSFPDGHSHVLGMCQPSEEDYYVGSTCGVTHMTEHDGRLEVVEELVDDSLFSMPQVFYYHPLTSQLLIGSVTDGMLVYDLVMRNVEGLFDEIADVPVTGFFPFGRDKVLLSTLGAGIFLYDFRRNTIEPYLSHDTNEPNGMNGNHIRALYLDEAERLWMSVYPVGVTVYDKAYPEYKWYKHYIGNPNSLGNDQVNHIIEDTEGDLWYATAAGVSVYYVKSGMWEHLSLSSAESGRETDYTFLALCEVSPGIVWAGGYMTGVYQIDKKTKQVTLVPTMGQARRGGGSDHDDNFIRVIYKDSEGLVWTGGSAYLRSVDTDTGERHDYHIGNAVTCLLQKDSVTLLVGTGDGIYTLDKRRNQVTRMRMPFSSQHINSMYMHPSGDLYIGTTNSGMAVLHGNGEHRIYTYKMSALLNDIVNTILPQGENHLILTTEQNVALFDIEREAFYNWTEDQGLIEASFNPRAALHTSRGTYVFGSNMGAIELRDDITLPKNHYSKVIFDQILVDNKQASTLSTVRQSAVTDLNSISELNLAHHQNRLSFHLSGINYGNPQHTYFQWRLWGATDYWTQGGGSGWVHLHDLKPGEYVLHVQYIAQEDYSVIGEKTIRIVIAPSFWDTGWAVFLYLIVCGAVVGTIFYLFRLRREQRVSRGRIKRFLESVVHFRVPLALTRVSLDGILADEGGRLESASRGYLRLATECLDQLYQLSTRMLEVEIPRRGTDDIMTVKRNFGDFMRPILDQLVVLADKRKQKMLLDETENLTEIWINEEKMHHIISTLLTAMLKYTPAEGRVHLAGLKRKQQWRLVISNEADWKKVIRRRRHRLRHCNQRVLRDELYLLSRLAEDHKGRLLWWCGGEYSYTFVLEFPFEHSKFVKSAGEAQLKESEPLTAPFFKPLPQSDSDEAVSPANREEKRGLILIVDEDPMIISYLGQSLSAEWKLYSAQSAEFAMELIRDKEPDIIICGLLNLQNPTDDLCLQLKSNFDTSHIPIVMLTSDDNAEQMEGGVRLRADHYINKMLDLHLISSLVVSILENRKQLQERLSKADAVHHLKNLSMSEVQAGSHFIESLQEIIKENLNNADFGVDDLATFMGMSRTSLYNKVRDLTGKSPSDMIRDYRMHYAAKLLLSDKHSISDVSSLLGFSDTKYFREVFRRHFGKNPSEYLKQHVKSKDMNRNAEN